MDNINQNSDYLQHLFQKNKIMDLQLNNQSYAFESSSPSLPHFLYQNSFSKSPFSSLFGSPFGFHGKDQFHTQNYQGFVSTTQTDGFCYNELFHNETKINHHHPLNHNQVVNPEIKPDNRRRTIEVKMKGDKEQVVIKGQWTYEEDRLLIRLVKENGKRNWSKIASKLRGRVGKQCRERWQNHLQPHIKKDRWSEEEDRMLIAAHRQIGNKWSEMAKMLPGRSENTIKNHWNATKRKQLAQLRRGDDNNTCFTVLQRYINSLMMISDPPPASASASSSAVASGGSINYSPVMMIQPPPSAAHEIENNNSVYKYCVLEKEEMFPVSCGGGVGEEDSNNFIAMMCSDRGGGGGSGYEFGSSSTSCSINGIMCGGSGTVTPSTATNEEELVVDAKTEMDFLEMLTSDY